MYNSLFSAKSRQNPASIDGQEQNKKLPPVGTEPTTSTLHHHTISLPTELSHYLVV